MTTLAIHRAPPRTQAIALPAPRVCGGAITIRPASLQGADVMFIDELMKQHSHMVGFMPLSQIEKRIAGGAGEQNGKVLIAQDPATTQRLGYIIFADKYFKREDLGIVYQLNIVPDKQRGLVGAALVKAAFDSCPWGVKLFCCWCAQDLAANHFWESIGFVPIAFRAGSRGKAQGGKRKEGRMQIFWQKRIREGDDTSPYWYPTETSGGAMKENRIALPIPPGTHWSDALPFVLPGGLPGVETEQRSALHIRDQRSDGRALTSDLRPPTSGPASAKRKRAAKPAPAAAVAAKPRRGLWFESAASTTASASASIPAAAAAEAKAAADSEPAKRPPNPPKPARPGRRNDPKLVAAAREWRDRYLEQVNAGLILPPGNGKYDVSRQLEAAPPMELNQVPLLDAA